MNSIPERKITVRYNLLIAIAAALFFIPFLGGVHLFDWDEINFAESAREMIVSGDYQSVQINFIPFWEKPPLFIWMQVLSMKVFGINEFAARFPNAVCGIITLLVLFNMGKSLRGIRFGITWVFLYMGSLLPFLYFKSGIIDPWFNLFIFLGIYEMYLYFSKTENKLAHAAISALFIGLAILTKGPVAFLVFALTFAVFILVNRFRVNVRLLDILVFVVVLAFTGGFWFILQILQGNFGIIADFIAYQIRLFKTQDAGHGGFLFYHFVVLFFGVFPASIIAFPALFPSKYLHVTDNRFYVWMLILFWIVLILFTIVRTKIVHYSSLCYFPVTFLASWALWYFKESFSGSWKKIITWLVTCVGSVLAILVIMLSFIDGFKYFIIEKGFIKDPFAVACLGANGGWTGAEFITGLVLIAGIIGFQVQQHKNFDTGVRILTLSVTVFMFLTLLLVVPRVEAYSQRSAIEFFDSISDEDVYVTTIGYKSYAHLFYGKVKNNSLRIESRDKQWLLAGDIDKRVYYSMKITRKEKFMNEYPEIVFLYEKNGFAFFKREPE